MKRLPKKTWLTRAETSAVAILLATACLTLTCRADAAPLAQRSCAQNVVHHAVAQPVVQKVVNHCAQPVVAHHAAAVVTHQAYVPPVQNFFYGVGQGVAQEAQMARAVKSALAEHRFNAEVRGTITGSVQSSGAAVYQPQSAPAAQPPTFSMTAPAGQAVNEHCAACHSGGRSDGGLSLESMTADQRLLALQRVADGSMPPNQTLTKDEKTRAVLDLLGK